jgi:hypothetical protein
MKKFVDEYSLRQSISNHSCYSSHSWFLLRSSSLSRSETGSPSIEDGEVDDEQDAEPEGEGVGLEVAGLGFAEDATKRFD